MKTVTSTETAQSVGADDSLAEFSTLLDQIRGKSKVLSETATILEDISETLASNSSVMTERTASVAETSTKMSSNIVLDAESTEDAGSSQFTKVFFPFSEKERNEERKKSLSCREIFAALAPERGKIRSVSCFV